MNNLKEMLLEGLTPANEMYVDIDLESDYKWGRGWNLEEKNRFEKEVYGKLKDIGYSVSTPKMDCEAPTLTRGRATSIIHPDGKIDYSVPDSLSLYLHPMCFSGYARQEDIDEIVKVLDSCESVYKVRVRTEIAYFLIDSAYKNLLAKHSIAILEWAKEYKKHRGNLYDIGFDFAKKFRVPRVGDSHGCLSSGDTDIDFIENAVIIFGGLGLL